MNYVSCELQFLRNASYIKCDLTVLEKQRSITKKPQGLQIQKSAELQWGSVVTGEQAG
jgi:hypothetical protein